MPAVHVRLYLHLVIEVHLGRVHGLGELLGLPGKFVELGQGVLGGVGKCRAAPHPRDRGHTNDYSDQRPANNEIRHGRAVKFQDFESFDCVD